MPQKLLYSECKYGRLVAGQQPFEAVCPCCLTTMLIEACCQVDCGINADIYPLQTANNLTISTIHTPDEVKSLMKDVSLKLPIIVMDGAALYDLNEKEYLETEFLQTDICEAAEKIIANTGMHCFVNVLYDTTLLTFYGDLRNSAEKDMYEAHKHSSYRNYTRSTFRRHDFTERVLYIIVLDEDDKVYALEERLNDELGSAARITVTDSEYGGYKYLRVFSPKALKEYMLLKLKIHTGCEKVVTIGSIKGKYDLYISDGGGNSTIKKIKKLYRKNIYHSNPLNID